MNTNNNTQDFYIEVIRARSLDPGLTLEGMCDKLRLGTFEYKAFGISMTVACNSVMRAFKEGNIHPLATSPIGGITDAPNDGNPYARKNEDWEEVPAIPADICRIGWFDYNDNGTVGSPINITAGAGDVKLTNDTLGAQTKRTYAPVGVTDIWNETTSQFDFSELNNGDMLDIRATLLLTTTSPNQEFEFNLNLGIGGFTYNIPFASGTIKSAGTHRVSRFNGVYVGDDNTRLNAAEFTLSSSDDATVEVDGWYCKVLKQG